MSADLYLLLPLLVLGSTVAVQLIAIAVRRSHALTLGITLAGLILAFASLRPAERFAPGSLPPLLTVDRYAIFYMGLIIAATLAVALLSRSYFESRAEQVEEFYVLLVLAALGSAVLAASSHFASFFLGLEILSVSLYAMSAYLRVRALSLEAGLKYLVLAASSAAFLLFGMALIYGVTGTMAFDEMGARIPAAGSPDMIVLLAGVAFLITGFGFKLGLVPFHMWTPDVYEGAPAPVTAFVATVSKGAMFAVLLRYFYRSGISTAEPVMLVLALVAAASMLAGNLLALLQSNVKRILAYSSIAHLGYLLVALLAGGQWAEEAVGFYLVAYFVTTIGAFGVVTLLSGPERDAASLEDSRGLFWRRPGTAIVFTLTLLSLAGIPLTAGFVGKFYVVAAGISAAVWTLVFLLIATSAVGLFYYLRILVVLYQEAPQGEAEPVADGARFPAAGSGVLAILALLLLWLGLYPSPVLQLVRNAMSIALLK